MWNRWEGHSYTYLNTRTFLPPSKSQGDVEAVIVTLDLVRVATAFKKLPFQVRCREGRGRTVLMPHGIVCLSMGEKIDPSPPGSSHLIRPHIIPTSQEDVRYFTVDEIPPPKNLIWHNLTSPSWARRLRTGLVWTAVIALILGYTIPVGFASSLANLQGLVKIKAFRWLGPVLDVSPALTGFIQGFLPPLVIAIFLALLPALLKCLSEKQGLVSEVCTRGWGKNQTVLGNTQSYETKGEERG